MKLNEFQKVAEILAKEHKIKINQGDGWSVNIEKRNVYYKKEDIYNLQEDHILGLLLHEIAHIHYTNIVKMPKKNPELTFVTLNMIEDISIEHIISNDYPNAEEILESTKEEMLDIVVQMLPKMKNVSIYEKSLLYAAAKFENRGYEYETEDYEILGTQICKIMIKNKKTIYNRKKTKDLMPTVEKIVDLMIKQKGEPNQKEKEEMMDENQNRGNATNTNNEEGKIKKEIIKNLKRNQGWNGTDSTTSEIKFIDEIADQATKIGKQLRSILKRNNAIEFGGRYRTGKLLTKRIIRIATIKDRHPFSRRIIKSNKSYAFAIASDVSGSMFNNNNEKKPVDYALTSMYMVGEALKYAGIPRSLNIFGKNALNINPINKNKISWEQITNDKNLNEAGNNNTYIDKAINICTQELKKIKAERKIMIILTDGISSLNEMKKAHKKAKKENIECLGITIRYPYDGKTAIENMNETFSKEKNKIIENTDNTDLIGKAFIDILKTSITKSP